MLAISALVAEAIAVYYGADLATMALANAPRAVPEILLMAQVLHLGVPLVASFQIVRVVLSLPVAALFFNIYRRAEMLIAARKTRPGNDQ